MPIPHPPCGLAAPAPRHYTFKFAAKMVSLIPEARASAQAPNIEAAWPKMSHIMFRGFRGLDSCFMTCHLTTVQVQGLAADVFCTSWETVWGLKILTYYGFHASIAYCKFFFWLFLSPTCHPWKVPGGCLITLFDNMPWCDESNRWDEEADLRNVIRYARGSKRLSIPEGWKAVLPKTIPPS